MKFTKCMALLILGSMLIFTKANGQKVEVGSPYRALEGDITTFFSGSDRFTVKLEKKEIVIQKLDCKTLSEVGTKTIKNDPKKGIPTYYQQVGDNHYIMFLRKKSSKQVDRYVRKIDVVSGELLDDEIPFAIGNNEYMAFEMYTHDREKLIRAYKSDRGKEDEKKPRSYTFRTYNAALEVVGERVITMPYAEGRMDFKSFIINNKGDYVSTVTVYDDYPKKDRKLKHYELFRVKAGGNEVETYVLEFPKRLEGFKKIFTHFNDVIVCTGFCNPDGKNKVTATFVARFSPEGKLISETIQELPVWDLMRLYTMYSDKDKERLMKEEEKNNMKNRKETVFGLSYLNLDFAEIHEDGSVMMIAQEYYYTQRTEKGVTSTMDNYDDIYTFRITPEGKLDWVKKLPKAQIVIGGYHCFMNNGKHYYMFTDTELNKNLPESKVPAVNYLNGGWLTVTTVDDFTGEVNKQYVVNFREEKGPKFYQFDIKKVHQLSENEVVFQVYKKDKEWLLIKVTM